MRKSMRQCSKNSLTEQYADQLLPVRLYEPHIGRPGSFILRQTPTGLEMLKLMGRV